MSTKKGNLQKQFNAVHSCMGCGDCGFAIRPSVQLNLTCPVKEVHPTGFEPFFSRGKMTIAKGLLDGDLEYSRALAEILYQCTECGACHETCHQSRNPTIENFVCRWIDHVKVWEALRRDLVENGFAPLPDHARLLQGLKDPDKRNPYGEPVATRKKWINNAAAASAVNSKSDVMFFAGCTAPYRDPGPLSAFITIVTAAGISMNISGQEWCCGSVALRIGDVETAREMAAHNAEDWRAAGVKAVVTNCAGCYRTFAIDYPELLGKDVKLPTFQHAAEFALNLARAGKLKFAGGPPQQVSYHDPCHLGRHMKVYEPPRQALQAIPGVTLVEMPHNRNNAWCCGAGGGLKSQFPQLAADIGKTRIQEFLTTGASLLITTCPFCQSNLQGALKNAPLPGSAQPTVLDLLEFIAKNLAK
jgi:heterodisulfide reductase subunit D